MNIPVVTIDGPSGSGKGTVARRIAERYGFHLLDSGALYRIAAFEAERRGIDLTDEEGVVEAVSTVQINFALDDVEGVSVLLDGVDVTRQIRAETAGMKASQVAPMPGLRAALLDVQRNFQRAPGLVADGRDMGTVVFPEATLKIFLVATAEERASRRYKQLKEKGIETKIDSLLREITARDERDQNRSSSPLCAAEDAHTLDSTSLSIEEVEHKIVQLMDNCLQTPV